MGYRLIERIRYDEDQNSYPACRRVILLAGYRDIFLSYFSKTQRYLEALVSGAQLFVDEQGCMDLSGNRVLLFSGKFKEEIKSWLAKGYVLAQARVNHRLLWKGEGEDREIVVIQPEIELEHPISL